MSKQNLPEVRSAKLEKVSSDSQKSQGKTPETGNHGRSLGSEFNMAVGSLKEQAKQIKGSKNAFMGVPSQLLDPTDYSHSIVNPKKNKDNKYNKDK